MTRVFISHSSEDYLLAEKIIGLIRDAMNLAPDSIRCTSVDGYRLPGGDDTDETLRQEVSESEIFIALLSKSSIHSIYVVFELGARWAVNKKLVPLLAPNLHPKNVVGPISSLNCLSCTSSSQLHQFVSELAADLNLALNNPATYHKWIDQISINENNFSKEAIEKSSKKIKIRGDKRRANNDPESDVLEIIKNNAAQDHPNDFSTQRHVISEQIKSWKKLNNYSNHAIPDDVLEKIMQGAREDHPYDFSTQIYVVEQQVSDWLDIQG